MVGQITHHKQLVSLVSLMSEPMLFPLHHLNLSVNPKSCFNSQIISQLFLSHQITGKNTQLLLQPRADPSRPCWGQDLETLGHDGNQEPKACCGKNAVWVSSQ